MSSPITPTGLTASNPFSLSTVTPIGLTNSNPTDLSSSLAVSGLASGMNWQSVVQELGDAERAPETQWKQEQTTLNTQGTAFSTIQTDLTTLRTDVQNLQAPSLYANCTAQTSDADVGTASAASGATTGTFTFDITELATAAQINGQAGISTVLCPDGNPADVTIGTAGFATPVTAGTFTVNGAQVTIAATDSLQQVFANISNATNGEVTASYDANGSSNDKITLTDNDGNNIVLGSAADTSNFLQAAGLYNNQSTSVSSLAALGHVQMTAAMSDADLKTPITGGTNGQGAFTINGVTIDYNTNSDSIQDVLDRINSSGAGVTASYDVQNNRFVLANNTTGDVGIALNDVTGTFLAATGLSGGQLVNGKNLLYNLNGASQQLVSESNTITSESSGITGLSVTALAQTTPGTPLTVTVSDDNSSVSSAVQQFVADYNTVQSYITSQMAVTNNPDGSVTPGLLTGDLTADDIASNLRSTGFSADAALATSGSAIQSLADLGITTNGQNNTISLDSSTLDSALTSNLNAVQSFFTDANGPVAQLNNYLNDTLGSPNSTTPGTLTQHLTDLSTQSSDITTQISNLETKITSDTQEWDSEFEAMEQAESTANSEMTYLSEQVTNGTL